MFCMEQRNHPIKGDVLTLGQQAVYSTVSDLKNIFYSYNIIPKNLPNNFDSSTNIPAWQNAHRYKNYTNAQSLFTIIGAKNVYATDISPYENPDYLIDLNEPVD